MAELVDVIAALSWQPLPAGPRVALVSNAGVLAADACERYVLTIARLSAATTERLRALLPEQASVRNPVDTTAGIPADVFGEGVRLILDDDGVEALSLLVRSRLTDGDGWLAPADAAELMRLVGIPHVETRYATDEDTAFAALAQLGTPVVVKADAAGLLHKSAGGGVILGVTDAAGVRTAMRRLRQRFGPVLRGVVLQPMVPPGRDLLVGLRSDAVFGPLVVFGLGGVDTDIVDDRCARLAPLTDIEADLLMDGLRSSTLLWSSGLDRAAVREVLLRVSRLAELVPEIAELHLNPLRVTANGCRVLDVRVRLERREPSDPSLRCLRA